VVELLPSGQGVNPSAALPSALLVHVCALRLAGGIIRSGGVKVKGLVVVISLAILPVGLILFGPTDLTITVTDAALPTTKQRTV
jgi:hypothetical protein